MVVGLNCYERRKHMEQNYIIEDGVAEDKKYAKKAEIFTVKEETTDEEKTEKHSDGSDDK